jgi:hypothetical protein
MGNLRKILLMSISGYNGDESDASIDLEWAHSHLLELYTEGRVIKMQIDK